MNLIKRITNKIRWKLGLPIANELLETKTDDSISEFYNSRVTYCKFLTDPGHYEFPRFEWIMNNLYGKTLLEIGCGDGGMTEYFSQKYENVVAMDVSEISLASLRERGIKNVTIVKGLIETYVPEVKFDCIVMSEVIEHLRDPMDLINQVYSWLAPSGRLLITTPNGYWESDEHLHEFSMSKIYGVVSKPEPESVTVGYIRDNVNRRRWLAAVLCKGDSDPSPNDFFSAKARKKNRNL